MTTLSRLAHGLSIDPPAPALGRAFVEAFVTFVAIAGIFALDVLSGQELSASPLYLLVVGYLAWKRGRQATIVAAIACAAAGVAADHLLSGEQLTFASSFEHPAVPWWNGAARLFVNLCVGLAIASLQEALRARQTLVRELQQALAEVRTLEGLLPICAWCKRIRDEEQGGSWMALDHYLAKHTPAEITHGICPTCAVSQLGVKAHDSTGVK